MKQISNIIQYFPHDESDELVIYFGSASATRLEGIRELERFQINKLFVRDPGRGWYNTSIAGLSKDADSLAEELKRYVENFDACKVTFIGSSMGGYGALLLGSLLGVGKIRAVAPQIILSPQVPLSPKTPVKYSDLTEIINKGPRISDVKIWFGCGELQDAYQIMRCQGIPGLEIFGIPNALHNVLAHLKKEGRLNAFFDTLVCDVPFDHEYADLTRIPYEEIQAALDCLYFSNNAKQSLERLLLISAPPIDSALHAQIGMNYFKAGQGTDGLTYLHRAIELNPINYVAHEAIGSIAMSTGQYALAIKHYRLAIENFPGKNQEYLAQLAGGYRLMKQFNEALEAIQECLSIKEYWKGHYYRGLLYRDLGRFDDAVEEFIRVQKLNIGFAPAHNQLEFCLARFLEKNAQRLVGQGVTVKVSLPQTRGTSIPKPEPEKILN